MKTLRKVSFENFERVTVIEASQLYGGIGDVPPTTSMQNDSTQVNKNDSIQTPSVPKATPKHTISTGTKVESNKSKTVNGSYTVTSGGCIFGVTGGYNTKTGGYGGVTTSYSFGGKKK
ncbi:hypothetical protein [Bacteroides sp.]|uniref:hypothetical protein n=1 Tax=Bacteroides sp. TaxID=29523 RepID=UPI002FC82A56